jgi:hypothetical protein
LSSFPFHILPRLHTPSSYPIICKSLRPSSSRGSGEHCVTNHAPTVGTPGLEHAGSQHVPFAVHTK